MGFGHLEIVALVKSTIEALTPTTLYLRAHNEEEANIEVPNSDIKSQPIGIHVGVPDIEQTTTGTNGKYLMQWPVEVFFAELTTVDAKPEEIDAILDRTKQLADQFFDNIKGQPEVDKANFIESYNVVAFDNLKVMDDILSGWRLTFEMPVTRNNFCS